MEYKNGELLMKKYKFLKKCVKSTKKNFKYVSEKDRKNVKI